MMDSLGFNGDICDWGLAVVNSQVTSVLSVKLISLNLGLSAACCFVSGNHNTTTTIKTNTQDTSAIVNSQFNSVFTIGGVLHAAANPF